MAVLAEERGVEVIVRPRPGQEADDGPRDDVRVVVVVVPDTRHSDGERREAGEHHDDGLVHLPAAALREEADLPGEVERHEAEAAEGAGRVPGREALAALNLEVLVVLHGEVVRTVAPREGLVDVHDEEREGGGLEDPEDPVVEVVEPVPLILGNCIKTTIITTIILSFIFVFIHIAFQ